MNKKIALALVIAVFLDLADFVVGWIPIAGDVLDIIGIAVLFPLIGYYALLPVVEFVPFIGDFIPTFTVAVVLAKMKYKGEWF